MPYQLSVAVNRAIGPSAALRTVTRVITMSFSRRVTGLVYSTRASPLRGGVSLRPASTDCVGACVAGGVCASTAVNKPATTTTRAHVRVMTASRR